MAAPFQREAQETSVSLVFLKWVLAGILSLWVKVPLAIQALLVLMLIDYATGLLGALIAGSLSSRVGFRGLGRKVLTLLLVGATHYVVRTMNLNFDFASTVAAAFAANELISITENCAEAGVPIPPPILDVLVRARRISGRS